MEQSNLLSEFEEKEKLGSLKTLTVLTFIGSGIAFIGAIFQLLRGQSNYDAMQKAIDDGTVDKLPGFLQGSYTPEKMAMMKKMIDNSLPIFIITVICAVLCVFGAIQMRKLKKEGYWIWLLGEVLPLLTLPIFIGIEGIVSVWSLISYGIIALFIILYSLQKKHLTK